MEVVEFPFLELSKLHMDAFLYNLFWGMCISSGVELGDLQRSLLSPTVLWLNVLGTLCFHFDCHFDYLKRGSLWAFIGKYTKMLTVRIGIQCSLHLIYCLIKDKISAKGFITKISLRNIWQIKLHYTLFN